MEEEAPKEHREEAPKAPENRKIAAINLLTLLAAIAAESIKRNPNNVSLKPELLRQGAQLYKFETIEKFERHVEDCCRSTEKGREMHRCLEQLLLFACIGGEEDPIPLRWSRMTRAACELGLTIRLLDFLQQGDKKGDIDLANSMYKSLIKKLQEP